MTVIDLVPFGYGIDILLLRVQALADVVDLHVIGEGTHTFTGEERVQLWPQIEADIRFAPYIRKMRCLTIETGLETYPQTERTAWLREQVQRDLLLDWWRTVRDSWIVPGDRAYLLLGDHDEIPNPAALWEARWKGPGPGPLTQLRTRYHEWHLDWRAEGSPEHLWEFRQPLFGTEERFGRSYTWHRGAQDYDTRSTAFGWHFTLQGGAAACAAKLRSYSHTELAHFTPERCQERIDTRRDILDRANLWPVLPHELPHPVARGTDFDHMLSPDSSRWRGTR